MEHQGMLRHGVVPGYLGSVENIDTFARQLGLPNKVHVMTDLPNFEKFEEVMDMLEDPNYANLLGIDNYKQYVSVFANYVLARNANQYEDEDMWIPPSAAVAGKMYQGDVDGRHAAADGRFQVRQDRRRQVPSLQSQSAGRQQDQRKGRQSAGQFRGHGSRDGCGDAIYEGDVQRLFDPPHL